MSKTAKTGIKPPHEGFRRRINPWYSGMNRQQITKAVVKTALGWLVVTVLSYAYWLAMLLLASIFLLNVWHVEFPQLLIYSGVLCAITSVIYAYICVHKKLFY